MDKLRMVNQIKSKHRKWTPEITGTIDGDNYISTVIGPYDHEPLQTSTQDNLHEILDSTHGPNTRESKSEETCPMCP